MIASDGSCLSSGAMGWAWARDDGEWLSNGFWNGTNQRAELWGVLAVLLAHPTGSIKIQMDSQYALNIAESWAAKWARNGWMRSRDKPVLNLDLVVPIYDAVSIRTDPLEFEWVKGHDISRLSPLNHQADRLAGQASRRASRVFDDISSLDLYRDSKGRTSNKYQSRMMVDIIEGRTGNPVPEAQEFNLFGDMSI